jgi:hypothetical protein
MTNHQGAPQPERHPYAEPQQIGVTADGSPIYRWPQPVEVHHHYPPAAPARRGLQPGEVLGWVMVGGAVAGTLLAVAVSAVAIAIASVCVALAVLVLRAVWKDVAGGFKR